MKKIYLLFITITILSFIACYNQDATGDHGAINNGIKINGDKTLYGLACDGCSDSAIVFLPNDGGDPLHFNIVNARKNNKVFGTLEIGDELAILLNPKNKKEAILAIDLEQIKGTWTFQVMPKLKPNPLKSEEQIMAEMSDSLKQALFIPREYGFTLKSYNQASPVGYIMKTNTLEDESPVEYPKVTVYTSWHIYNGWLYIYKDTVDEQGRRLPNDSVGHDDGTMVFLSADSMAAKFGKKVMQYHRKASAIEANRKAQEAEKRAAEKKNLKKK